MMTLAEHLDFYLSQKPVIQTAAFIAPSAEIMGAVTLGELSSVWYQCVLRADINSINIGRGTNVQDGTIIHLSNDRGVEVGEYCTIGHRAILHACQIGNETLIGMNATLLDGAIIGNQCIVGAASLVTKNTIIPDGSLVMGSPARLVRMLTVEERAALRGWAEKYLYVAQTHALKLGSV